MLFLDCPILLAARKLNNVQLAISLVKISVTNLKKNTLVELSQIINKTRKKEIAHSNFNRERFFLSEAGTTSRMTSNSALTQRRY